MTKNPQTENDRWDLLFSVRRSVRYHIRRERWYDTIHKRGTFIVAVFTSATFTSLLVKLDPTLIAVLSAVPALICAFELVYGTSKAARQHNDLARDYISLEKDMVVAGETPPESDVRAWQARRLEIEAHEPPVRRVLDAICHDELITALGIKDSERSNVGWWQRWCANIMDIGAHRLRKQVSP